MHRHWIRPLLALLVLAPASQATWSIVCVNLRTREVGVASATCLVNFNLRRGVPVVYIGEGAAAAQSFIDLTNQNKRLIFESFRDTEQTPAEILARLAAQDSGHQTRQYGIVNFAGDPVTFTGTGDGLAATGVTGRVDDFVYAIQGNVLTGDEVVFAAEAAFRGTKGDMGQKLMSAMHAARDLGGDGRCSCSEGRPTSCGVPPPSFTKSAHVGFVIVARMGDLGNGCNVAQGCARGDYYLLRNVIGDEDDLDPVFTLQSRYDFWRKNLSGRPDGILSRVSGPKTLPADGATRRTVEVRLQDVDGVPLDHGEALVEVRLQDDSRAVHVGPVQNLGDGSYRFTVTGGEQPGRETLVITATHTRRNNPEDTITATLYPYLEIETVFSRLHIGSTVASGTRGAEVPFVVNIPEKPFAPYLLVARARPFGAGTGFHRDGFGPLLRLSAQPFFPAGPGRLDGKGRGEAWLSLPPKTLDGWPDVRIEVRGLVLDGGPLEVTNRVGFDLAR